MYIVLFSIFFAINVGIGAYFAYYKYVNRDKKNVSRYDYVYQTTIYKTYKMGEVKQMHFKNRTYYFYNGIIDLKFNARLLKIGSKSYKSIGIYKKKLMIGKKLTV